jgi:hypothetical protein
MSFSIEQLKLALFELAVHAMAIMGLLIIRDSCM